MRNSISYTGHMNVSGNTSTSFSGDCHYSERGFFFEGTVKSDPQHVSSLGNVLTIEI